jgi:hypothetical protein
MSQPRLRGVCRVSGVAEDLFAGRAMVHPGGCWPFRRRADRNGLDQRLARASRSRTHPRVSAFECGIGRRLSPDESGTATPSLGLPEPREH